MLSTIAAINFASHLSEDRRRQGLGLPADLAILCNPELTFPPPEDRWSSSNAATRTNGQQHFRRTFTFSMDSPTQQFSPWVSSLNCSDETRKQSDGYKTICKVERKIFVSKKRKYPRGGKPKGLVTTEDGERVGLQLGRRPHDQVRNVWINILHVTLGQILV